MFYAKRYLWTDTRALTLAAWCYKLGYKTEAVQLILPDLQYSDDDSTFEMSIRESYGHIYHMEMLNAFSRERNYDKTIMFAEQLAKPVFNGYIYQSRAIELENQLKLRKDDFITFILPNYAAWDSIKKTFSREEQIKYLANRFRLLNCEQMGQPADINYSDYQTKNSMMPNNVKKVGINKIYDYEADRVINPYSEIINMHLNYKELKYLVPYLADDNYIPTFSFWRNFDFHRKLHRVSWVVADLLFRITNMDLADLKKFEYCSSKEKKTKIDSILKWCDANANMSKEELLLDILKNSKNWTEFESAMNKAVKDTLKSVVDILIKRFPDFKEDKEFWYRKWPTKQSYIAKNVFFLGTKDQVAISRKWQKEPDNWVKLYSSLLLLKYGDIATMEGFNTLTSIIDSCDGSDWYPDAINILIGLHSKEAMNLAESFIDNNRFKEAFYISYNEYTINKLLLAGSEKALKFMVDGLENTKINIYLSKSNNLNLLYCDNYVDIAIKWHPNNIVYNLDLPVEKRAKISNDLSKWLQEQFKLIKEGKESNIKSSDKIMFQYIQNLERP